jgi:hypothetical protein
MRSHLGQQVYGRHVHGRHVNGKHVYDSHLGVRQQVCWVGQRHGEQRDVEACRPQDAAHVARGPARGGAGRAAGGRHSGQLSKTGLAAASASESF